MDFRLKTIGKQRKNLIFYSCQNAVCRSQSWSFCFVSVDSHTQYTQKGQNLLAISCFFISSPQLSEKPILTLFLIRNTLRKKLSEI